jgi:hypothetical protein
MTRTFWVSCRKFTVRVVTDEHGVITEAAPIVRRFIGQPLGNLTRWAAREIGGLRVESWLSGIMKLTSKGERNGRTETDD